MYIEDLNIIFIRLVVLICAHRRCGNRKERKLQSGKTKLRLLIYGLGGEWVFNNWCCAEMQEFLMPGYRPFLGQGAEAIKNAMCCYSGNLRREFRVNGSHFCIDRNLFASIWHRYNSRSSTETLQWHVLKHCLEYKLSTNRLHCDVCRHTMLWKTENICTDYF